MSADARAALLAQASGATKRPRGNAVLAEEHAAAAPFARACAKLFNSSMGSAIGINESEYDGDPVPGPDLVYAAPEALPPLP